jgi:large subunit ribosomal protein L6
MSRVAKKPVVMPNGVAATITADSVTLKGPKGSLSLKLADGVSIEQDKQTLTVKVANPSLLPIGGSTRAHLSNMSVGVSTGYEQKLELVGVGYRAAMQGKSLNLTLGFSHPVLHPVPEGISIETPTQTEILIKGTDRQRVGQVAADIRRYRPPEPYKGKGVRYSGEKIEIKEAKKK